MRTGFSATMQRMLTRRTLVGMAAASLAGNALASRNLVAQAVAGSGQATGQESTQFSVMIWTLNKMGTFEENLERVAQAGYHHVELVGEFKKWSEDDYRRILARMDTLKPRLCGSLRRGCVPLCTEGSHPGRPAIGVQANHSALG
jgi:hypothetical protein